MMNEKRIEELKQEIEGWKGKNKYIVLNKRRELRKLIKSSKSTKFAKPKRIQYTKEGLFKLNREQQIKILNTRKVSYLTSYKEADLIKKIIDAN